MEYQNPAEHEQQAEQDLSKYLTILRPDWMASRLEYQDKNLTRAIAEVVEKLPPQPTLEDVAKAVKQWYREELATLSPDSEQAQDILTENKKPLLEAFVADKTPPLLGAYFDPEKPGNVCQQNVLLLAAVAAVVGLQAEVAGFIYTGSQSGLDRIHAVAVGTDTAGQEMIMDPTLMVPRYGDVTYLPKEEYLSRFVNPRLYAATTVFSPGPPGANSEAAPKNEGP